jgi:hypothetical protein
MTQNRKICPICKKRRIRNPKHKTCGNYECMGKYAEYKTKKRAKRQKAGEIKKSVSFTETLLKPP